MNKKVIVDESASKELNSFEINVRNEFKSCFVVLREKGRLERPTGKKIDKDLFEIRVKVGNSYRAFYAYIKNPYIVILHCFKKKTQKTPVKDLKLAKRRLKYYEK